MNARSGGCGISAKQLERQIGVSYKTAWRMLNKIRNQLMTQDGEPLSGDVEADETYIAREAGLSRQGPYDLLDGPQGRRARK
jgi:predicted DNA-binding transcriptional regulator YafY